MSETGETPAQAPARGASRGVALALLAALAGYLLLLGFLFRPAGGLRGTYAILDAEGQEIPVHSRIDPRIDFPVPRRLQAAYLFHWDLKRHGFPSEAPPYLVRWNGLLLAPEEGDYRFPLEARGEATLHLDGQPVAIARDAPVERRLGAGWHPIELTYTHTGDDARLILYWQPPGKKAGVIPSDHLAVDAAAHRSAAARRTAGWAVLILGAAAALIAAWIGRRGEGAAARVVSSVLAERPRLALAGIVLLAGLLRLDDHALVPFHHETADEYQHAWEGWHLLNKGYPASWSTFPERYPAGQVEEFRWFGDPYALVRPYFDHPPLFSIPVGIVASLAGTESFTDCALPLMRLVPILLSLAGILLLHRLALLYGASERGALLAALVYAVLPVIVVSHRLVKAENLLAPLFMGAILLAERHARSGKARDAALLGLVCGLSIWTKTTGVAVVATVMVLLLSRRRYRGTALALLVTGGLAALYLAYAWAYDFGVFLEVVRAQAESHWSSLEGFLDLLQSRVVDAPFGRGWYLWLLLCAGVAAFRKERALLLPLAIYAGLVVLMADFRALHGSYRIPLYPFLCVAAGIYLEEMIEASDLSRVFPFAVTAVLAGMLLALPPGLAQSQTGVLLFAVPAVAPFVVRLARDSPPTARIARLATLVLLALLLLTSVAVVGGLTEIDSTGSRRWR